jgi:GNAT superfamily N-acetyltransferase
VSRLLRAATPAETPSLARLIAESAKGLCGGDYTDEQIEAAIGTAWSLDTQLIEDGTYFVVEADGQLAGCGGWSRRRTLFGGDRQSGRDSTLLDPAVDAARIRAFFVRPEWARRGIGRDLLVHSEEEARRHGFRAAELAATLPGQRLYAAFGYAVTAHVQHPLAGGLTIEFVAMRKELR